LGNTSHLDLEILADSYCYPPKKPDENSYAIGLQFFEKNSYALRAMLEHFCREVNEETTTKAKAFSFSPVMIRFTFDSLQGMNRNCKHSINGISKTCLLLPGNIVS